MTELQIKILDLQSKGFSYKSISETLGCSKGTISYYLGVGQKEKSRLRVAKCRSGKHPYDAKIVNFVEEPRNKSNTTNYKNRDWKKIMKDKLETFAKKNKRGKYVSPTFSTQDVLDKFGEKPICYLTGEEIDIYQPRTYQFDHKIPRSRGGENTIENLGICTKEANKAKSDKTPEEFITLCKAVLEHNNYEVKAVTTDAASAST